MKPRLTIIHFSIVKFEFRYFAIVLWENFLNNLTILVLLPWTKFQNVLITELDDLDEREFVRFEFKAIL